MRKKQEGQVYILDRIGESGEAVLVKGVVPTLGMELEVNDEFVDHPSRTSELGK